MSRNDRKSILLNGFARAFVCLALLITLFPIAVSGQEYRVGEEDLLRITVYDNPDLTTEVRVSGDGMITVPLIGEVQVNGLTATEIAKKTAQLFADGYIKNPQVNVFILEYKSKKVTALGEFNKPGLIEMRGNATLMEVISNAGGITANAGDILYIQRNAIKGSTDRATDTTISVDLTKLLEGKDPSMNLPVLEGDSIYVPRAAFVYVTGEVKKPGAFKITKGLTVLRSITLAEGYTQKARKSKTKIIRKTDKGEESIEAKPEDLVMPDDIIIVPESFF
ncbi:MAG: polysaccharide biosynthesis/export family protein [Deltaproteobacteria bacterium]|nr:polysaccharide biosynthesis/export family protein [Deltaproteobacteria bacterium]